MNPRSLLILLVTTCFLQPVIAQDAAEFDRLFTSRLERKQLNQARDQYTSITQTHGDDNISDQGMFPEVQVKGLVVRKDGSSEIWINNTSTVGKDRLSQDLKSNTRRIDSQRVRVTLSDGEHITLKPGQVYTPDNQSILEGYQAALPAKPEPAPEEEIEEKESETKEASLEQDKEFDESVLAETDSKIKLLEERLEKLESRSNQ
ncbi:MAG: hypothetical protein JXA04_05660 [Gammaproteobacteria bacterium]|nr:hypothetical protein [Gammaproteobacteria bacterium]